MRTITIEGNITADEVADILRKHLGNKTIQIVEPHVVRRDKEDSYDLVNGNSLIVTELPLRVRDVLDLEEMLEYKTEKVLELETAKTKALDSANGFQKQHQTMYERFLGLRTQFDEQKTSLLKTLWVHCGAYHPDLREIPVLETSSKFFETDDRVGEYIIGETLGQGQFATVKSCCREGAEGTKLAIKIIKKERFTTFVALKRISIEIEMLRRLKSQYIVSIKDVLQTKNQLYLVTEKGGKDLFESFDDNPDGIPEHWARDIIMGVFQGKRRLVIGIEKSGAWYWHWC